MPNKTTGRRKRRSREDRQAERDGLTTPQRPTLVRKIADYDPYDEAFIEEIHEAAMRVIETLGIEFRDDESRRSRRVPLPPQGRR